MLFHSLQFLLFLPLVLACSALKERYRDRLRVSERARFVWLSVPPAVATARLQDRTGHFMPASLVASQFAALEEPADAIAVDATKPVDEIVAAVARLV